MFGIGIAVSILIWLSFIYTIVGPAITLIVSAGAIAIAGIYLVYKKASDYINNKK